MFAQKNNQQVLEEDDEVMYFSVKKKGSNFQVDSFEKNKKEETSKLICTNKLHIRKLWFF